MSRSTFARHFEQHFGRTPMDYLRDTRLRRGAQLLRTGGLSIDGIAGKVGFASRSHFSRAFQQQFGCSPSEFRKQQG
jgi:AraC-like DNA-binding protein